MQISVVVPAYNEELCIKRCLDSLARQHTQYPYEVIVVDNNCTDRTVAIAQSYPGVRVVWEQRQGLVPARQAGQDAAAGSVVAHTDADSELPEDWIERIGRAFEPHPQLVLASGAISFPSAPFLARLIQAFLNLTTLLWWMLTHRLAVVNGCNFAVRALTLESAGGFAVELPDTGDSRILSLLRPHGRVALLQGKPVQSSARRFRGQGVVHVYFFYLLEQLGALMNRPVERVLALPNVRLQEAPFARSSRRRRMLLLLPVVPMLALAGGCTYLAISPTSQAYGQIMIHGPRSAKIVALTFDDGPNEPYTSEILGVLDHYGVKATFFATATNAEYYPETTRDIVADGHVLANHSYDHSRLASAMDFRYRQLEQSQSVFEQVAGVRPALFRPPAGIHTPWQLRTVSSEGMVTINWDAEGMDWQKGATSDSIERRVLSEVKPGSIILLHDGDEIRHGSDRSETVDALPTIIESLQAQGYHFETVPQLLNLPPYQQPDGVAGPSAPAGLTRKPDALISTIQRLRTALRSPVAHSPPGRPQETKGRSAPGLGS